MSLPATCEEFARLLDYPLLEPQFTDHQVVEGLDLARRLGLGCALVRPCDIDLAVRSLQGSAVRPASVCGFPFGANNTATKLYEGRDLLRRGAREVELVAGVSKLLSREFQHVQAELLQMSESCHKEGAAFTAVIGGAEYLTEELKIIALRCAERAEADFVAAAYPEVALMRKYVPEEVGVKALGIVTLDQAITALEAGASKLSVSAPAAILEAWKQRFAAPTVG
jgi:deoxyribose-phosphate aldolase